MFKWFAILGTVTALGGAGYWVTGEILEKGRLEATVETQDNTISLLNIAMEQKAIYEVQLHNKILELENDANEFKKKFNLSAMQKIVKDDPVRAADLFTSNTDILYTGYEEKIKGFNNRHNRKTKVPTF